MACWGVRWEYENSATDRKEEQELISDCGSPEPGSEEFKEGLPHSWISVLDPLEGVLVAED